MGTYDEALGFFNQNQGGLTANPYRHRQFDPEGNDYDYYSAFEAGYTPDESGHWPSRVADTGLLLKGRAHDTWDLLEQGERDAGYSISKGEDGRYYSEAANYFRQNQGETSAITGKPMLTPEQKFAHLPTREQVGDFYTDAVDYFKGNIFGREPVGRWFDSDRVSGKERPALYMEPEYNFEIGEVDPVFHGGGLFKRFSDDFMKSGTGGHVFGWGHYVSEEKGVGKYYEDLYSKSGSSLKVDGRVLTNENFYSLAPEAESNPLLGDILRDLQRGYLSDLEGAQELARTSAGYHPEFVNEAVDYLKSGRLKVDKAEAGFYKAKLFKGKSPDDYTFLDWDKPVPDDVAKKIADTRLNDYLIKRKTPAAPGPVERQRELFMDRYSKRGDLVYGDLAQSLGSQEAASKFLDRAGISGVRYPVGSAGGTAHATKKNYVIFNPKNIQIEEGPGFRRIMEGGKPVKAKQAAMGFKPAEILADSRIKAAAIKLKDGTIFEGRTHHEAMQAFDNAGYTITDWKNLVDDSNGFITDAGEFITRQDAVKLTGEMSEDATDIVGRMTSGR